MESSELLLAGTTLAASFGGYLLAGYNEARRDRRAAAQERRSREEDARIQREAERHKFQLEALTALQEDIQRVARNGGKAMHFDHMQARAGKYTTLPEGWSEEDLAARLSLARNASRVLDEAVRAAAEELNLTTADVAVFPKTLEGLTGDALETAVGRAFAALVDTANRVGETVGSAVRRELAWEPNPPTDDLAGRRARNKVN